MRGIDKCKNYLISVIGKGRWRILSDIIMALLFQPQTMRCRPRNLQRRRRWPLRVGLFLIYVLVQYVASTKIAPSETSTMMFSSSLQDEEGWSSETTESSTDFTERIEEESSTASPEKPERVQMKGSKGEVSKIHAAVHKNKTVLHKMKHALGKTILGKTNTEDLSKEKPLKETSTSKQSQSDSTASAITVGPTRAPCTSARFLRNVRRKRHQRSFFGLESRRRISHSCNMRYALQ